MVICLGFNEYFLIICFLRLKRHLLHFRLSVHIILTCWLAKNNNHWKISMDCFVMICLCLGYIIFLYVIFLNCGYKTVWRWKLELMYAYLINVISESDLSTFLLLLKLLFACIRATKWKKITIRKSIILYDISTNFNRYNNSQLSVPFISKSICF